MTHHMEYPIKYAVWFWCALAWSGCVVGLVGFVWIIYPHSLRLLPWLSSNRVPIIKPNECANCVFWNSGYVYTLLAALFQYLITSCEAVRLVIFGNWQRLRQRHCRIADQASLTVILRICENLSTTKNNETINSFVFLFF